MNATLEELVDSLLYEGYALYPYTPGATKNATPTPFGIIYPPAYAAECAGAHDHARLECVALPGPGATLSASLRYLEPSGERHEASARRVELGPAAVGERVSVEFDGGRFTLRSEPLPGAAPPLPGAAPADADAEGGGVLVRSCVHNTRPVAPGLERGPALGRSLLSVHVVVSISAGRFISPLEAGRQSVNIWPVLATDRDDVVLGAAIALPDHPAIAPGSHGNLFDNTEIEEALVLHVHALTDAERTAAGEQDPVVRAMIERTLAVTPEQIIGLHSGLKESR